jgi:phosphoribosylcarboxyaminoimidazole (NCAIR) mutase
MNQLPSILLISSQNDASFAFASGMLSQFGVPFVALEFPRDAQKKIQTSFFCIIAVAQNEIQTWIQKNFPETSVLLVPQAQSHSSETLKAFFEAADQPAGRPVCVFAVGKAGASNAALFAVSMLATQNATLRKKLLSFRKKQTQAILANPIPA